MEWKPLTRRTYLEVGVVWICAIGSGIVGLLQGEQIAGKTDEVISCFTPSRWLKYPIFPLYIAYLVLGCIMGPAALLFSVVHYVYIFRELIKKNHAGVLSNVQPLWRNYQDIPIHWNSELRALNSMACVFIMTAVPFTAGSLYGTAVSAVAISKNITFEVANVPLLQLASLCSYLTPTASPLVILVINKRFRMRIKDWQLKPDNDTTSAGSTAVISHHNSRILTPLQPQHQGDEVVNSVIPPHLNKVLYNTWVSDGEMT